MVANQIVLSLINNTNAVAVANGVLSKTSKLIILPSVIPSPAGKNDKAPSIIDV